MDIIPTRGPHRGRVVPAIIDVTDSSLRLCCDRPGDPVHTSSEAPAGTSSLSARYRRLNAKG